jgi:DUF1680 family protein
LYQITNDRKYLDLAERMYPLLPEKGNQHSHGFLNTLRGVLMLYNQTKKSEQLEFVETKYNEVIHGGEYQVTGGVPEFFGSYRPGEGYRNEGCSEADFLMLCLELWKTTGNTGYLDKGEYCLLNEMYYNQYENGDFGSHHIVPQVGFRTFYDEDRAWWCCTYHGIMGLSEAQECVVTKEGDARKINLYAGHSYHDDQFGLNISKDCKAGKIFHITVEKAPGKETELAFRKPVWAVSMTIKLDGKELASREKNGYQAITRTWHKDEVIIVEFNYKVEIVASDGTRYDPENLPEQPVKGVLHYGPYVLAADDDFDRDFMSEPSFNNILYPGNKVFFLLRQSLLDSLQISTRVRDGYVGLPYKHDGFYGLHQVILRPVSENTFQHPANVRVWFNFRKKSLQN